MESTTKRVTRKALEPKKEIKTNIQRPNNKWVWILKRSVNTAESDVVNLRHPNSSKAAAFLFSHADNGLHEILTCDNKRSWFIDEWVKSEGSLKLSTPIDPIFLVLPYLKKHCSSQAIPLDQLLCDEEYPKAEILLKCKELKTLTLVADQKGTEDLQAYKYNEEKTLKWLETKTQKVASVLQQKGIGSITNGIASTTFTISSRAKNANPEEGSSYLKYAHGIVSEYIDPELSQKLLCHLNLQEEPISLKRKSTSKNIDVKKPKFENDENIKKSKLGKDENIKKLNSKKDKTIDNNVVESKPAEMKPLKQNAKEKLRAKAATGSKNIASFFKKS